MHETLVSLKRRRVENPSFSDVIETIAYQIVIESKPFDDAFGR